MSKIKDTIKDEVLDTEKEHELHNVYDPKCSTCYSDALKLPVGERVFLLLDNK